MKSISHLIPYVYYAQAALATEAARLAAGQEKAAAERERVAAEAAAVAEGLKEAEAAIEVSIGEAEGRRA